jgi:putative aldouronate transport system substrate-binding protein
MKQSIAGIGLAIVLAAGLAGCASQNGRDAAGTAPNGASASGVQALNPDDLSQKVTIRLVENGWFNTPTDDNDPWKKWIDSTFNVDFQLTAVPASDLESKLTVQFASNEPPDIIFANDRTVIQKLYRQGVLLDDWTPYLDRLPSVVKNFGETSKQYATLDGKMIGLPKKGSPNITSLKIRQDWLKNLGLSVPKTDEELLGVLKKFTFDDPDGDGKADTWGISSAGGGAGVGEIGWLEYMYGPVGFYPESGKAQHSIVAGTHLKFLEFMRKVVQEKLIDPDWYTQGWNQRKPKLYDGKLGIVVYPGVIVQEAEGATGNTGKTIDWFESMQIPKGAPEGGKRPPGSTSAGLIAVSAQAAKDPVKFARILKIIDATAFPNDGYWALRWGVGVNGQKVVDLDGGAKFINLQGEQYREEHMGAFDWGTWIATSADRVLESHNPQPGASDKKQLELDNAAIAMETYTNYMDLLTLDAQTMSDLTKMQNEFDIGYILGQTDDYEGFKQRWLAAGGQKLLDSATQQFAELGLSGQ